MGADTFHTISVGKTPEEAFRAARDRAQYEHGHAGYTGTIAEKGDFVLFTLPPRVSAIKFMEWIESPYSQGNDESYWASQLEWATSLKRGTEGRATRITEAKRGLAKHKREFAAFWKKVPVEHHGMVKSASALYDDKWGPAVAVELKSSDLRHYARSIEWLGGKKRGQSVYLFMGYASC